MLSIDSLEKAVVREGDWADSRVLHGWDENLEIADAFAKTLGLKGFAWDVYLIYAPGTRWAAMSASPTAPVEWMHQLPGHTGAPADRTFDEATFAESVEKVLKSC